MLFSKCLNDCTCNKKRSTENKWKLNATIIKWIKTIALIVVWVSMGMSCVLTPTALPDIRTRLGADVEQISRALAIGGLGGIVGGPLGSITDRYNTYVDVILSVCLFVGAVCIGTRCLTTNLGLFTVGLFIDGVSWPLINSAGNSVLMDMWGENGGAPMHALHFGYPLGAMIGPLIVYPFVSKNTDNITNIMNVTKNTTQPFPVTTPILHRRFKDDSTIEIPFLIVGCFITIIAVIFLIFQLTIPSSEITSSHNKIGLNWKGVFSPAKWAEGDTKFGLSIVVLCMLFYALHVACIKGPDTYSVVYAVDYIGYSNQEAALYNSLTHFAGALGRAIATICAKFIPIQIMFIAEVHAVTVTSILILIWGLHSKIPFLVLSCLFSFLSFPVWPSGYTWMDQYITLYAIVVGLVDMAAKASNALFSWLLGYLYTYTVPNSIFYNTTVTTLLLCILVIIMNIYGEKHGHRFRKGSENEDINLMNGFQKLNTSDSEENCDNDEYELNDEDFLYLSNNKDVINSD